MSASNGLPGKIDEIAGGILDGAITVKEASTWLPPWHRALAALLVVAIGITWLVWDTDETSSSESPSSAAARRGRMRPARKGETDAKEAHTHVRPIERFGERATWVEAMPLTGRTHQIRVHLLAIGHPLLFDHQYGQPHPVTEKELGGASDEVILSRTPLHAARLQLRNLEGLPDVELEAPLPADMSRALEVLRSGVASTA